MDSDPSVENLVDAQAEADLLKLIFGFRFSQVIYAAAQLGIADLLDDGAKSSEQLAAATGAHAQSLYRLLSALTHLGVVAEVTPGVFQLSSRGRPLRAKAPNSVKALTLSSCDDASWRSWGQLVYSVQTGRPAFDHIFGSSNFEYLARHPELAASYNEALARETEAYVPNILKRLNFARFNTVVDIGGGSGTLMSAILGAHPKLNGIIFDAPAGLEATQRVLDESGTADRCQVIAGDFLESVPKGGDAYILKSIVLDWEDDSVVQILTNCRQVIPPHGSIILIEVILPPRLAASDEYMTTGDLGLLVTTGGRERTKDEFCALLKSAGFALSSITPLSESDDIKAIEALPS